MNNQYIRVESPDDATHWIPTYDPNFNIPKTFKVLVFQILGLVSKRFKYKYQLLDMFTNDTVTPDIPYPILKSSEYEDQLVIVNNLERELTEFWMLHNGYLVKEST